MARMIDADRLLRELTALSHGQVWPGWTYDGIRLLIERQPTLTQPNEGAKDKNVPTNEPLTLEVLTISQLLQMLGEKVEVIRMGEMCQAEWATVRALGDCKTDSGCPCCHELYGKTCPMQYPYDVKACAILEACPYVTLIPYTNAEHIRAFSDEELAHTLVGIEETVVRGIAAMLGFPGEFDFSREEEHMRKWLQQPAEEETENYDC